MEEMYFTIAGCNHYYGTEFMEKGMKVKLVKEPDNEYDKEQSRSRSRGSAKSVTLPTAHTLYRANP